jgi:tetratricopeptide (TPR) repeat protein
MGPHLRAYLGLPSEAAPVGSESPHDAAALTQFLGTYTPAGAAPGEADLADLVDELIAMDLPAAALQLAARHPELATRAEFRTQLALGVAGMLTGDLDTAQTRLTMAQELLPDEPAPYVNMVQVLAANGRWAEAEEWALAGIAAQPNHHRLWEELARLYHQRGGPDGVADKLLALANERASWAGLSLGASLMATGDRYLKATLLERLYAQGERDGAFLVEYTGALGVAGELAKIPPIVWAAERTSSVRLPWQLHVHCVQAHLAMGEAQQALERLDEIERDPTLPSGAQEPLAELRGEARQALAEAGATPQPTLH